MTLPAVAACAIVRNEEKTFPRLADSLRSLVDYWVVVDTGSTDATRETISAAMGDIPGELHERPWVNFGHNRSELLELARGKARWLLLVDADQEIAGMLDLAALEGRGHDAYLLEHEGSPTYWVPRLLRGDLPWRYVGVTHEYLDTENGSPYRREKLADLRILHHADGGSRSDKFERDRALLLAEVEKNPDDARSWFYLARTYQDLGQDREALDAFRTRVRLGGWIEEAYYSQFQVGNLVARLDGIDAAVGEWLRAWEMRPERLEALHAAVRELRVSGRYRAALALARAATSTTPPDDVLFVHADVWTYELPLERSICSYYVDGPQSCLEQSDALLALPDLPESVRTFATGNAQLCRRQLAGAAAR